MLISCEKCSTTYVLEDGLIPPGGAPVQCTMCSHVFTAKPPAPQEARTLMEFDPHGKHGGKPVLEGAKETRPGNLPKGASASATTMVFGALPPAGPRGDARPDSASTLVSPTAPTSPPSGGTGASTSTTIAFGMPAAVRELAAATAPSASSQSSAAYETQTKTAVFGAIGPPPRPAAQTQVFGAIDPRGGTGATVVPSTPSRPPPKGEDQRATMVFGAVTLPPAPAKAAAQPAPKMDTGSGGWSTRPGPPVPDPVLPSLPTRAPRFTTSSGVDEVELALRKQLRRRRRIALVFVGLALVAGAAVAAWKLSGGSFRPQAPEEVLVERDAAFGLLRRDDAESKREASARLLRLARQHPESIEVRSAQVVALALEADDLRLEHHHLGTLADGLNRRIAKLKATQPSGWGDKANVLIERLSPIKKRSDLVTQQLEALDGEAAEAFNAMLALGNGLSPAQEVFFLRAQALFYGAKGREQTLAALERYRAISREAEGGWSAVALAEYAVNGRAPATTLGRAQAEIDGLLAHDSTFLRAYMLAARIAWAQRQADKAVGFLDQLLLLNPKHEQARQLKGWIRAAAPSEED